MTGAFRVDTEELLDTVDRLAGLGRRVLDALEQAEREADRLHATWLGAAADAHRQAHERWRLGARQMHEALTVMRRVAGGAHDNYASAVAVNASMWAF